MAEDNHSPIFEHRTQGQSSIDFANNLRPDGAEDEILIPEYKEYGEERWFHLPLMLQALVITAARLVAGLLIARVGLTLFDAKSVVSTGEDRFRLLDPGGGPLGSSFFQWDALRYLFVAGQGYPPSGELAPYFPGYPMLARVVEAVTTMPPVWSMLAVTWTAIFFAVWATMAISKRLWPERNPAWAGLFVAWGPGSVFLLSGYPTATFMALAAWCLYLTLRKQWFLAALVAAVATATRPEGVLLGVCLAVALLIDHKAVRAVLALVISQLGLVAYMVFQHIRMGDAFAFVQVQLDAGRNVGIPLSLFGNEIQRTFRNIFGDTTLGPDERYVLPLGIAFIVLGVALVVWLVILAVRDSRITPLALFSSLGLVAVVLSALNVFGQGGGQARQMVAHLMFALVPLYLLGSRIRRPFILGTALALSVATSVALQFAYHVA